jgi:hypothetical protein
MADLLDLLAQRVVGMANEVRPRRSARYEPARPGTITATDEPFVGEIEEERPPRRLSSSIATGHATGTSRDVEPAPLARPVPSEPDRRQPGELPATRTQVIPTGRDRQNTAQPSEARPGVDLESGEAGGSIGLAAQTHADPSAGQDHQVTRTITRPGPPEEELVAPPRDVRPGATRADPPDPEAHEAQAEPPLRAAPSRPVAEGSRPPTIGHISPEPTSRGEPEWEPTVTPGVREVDAPDPITVHIGRIEVRATQAAQPVRAAQRSVRPPPRLALGDYLARQRGRRR